MQKIVFRRLLLICAILLLPSTGCASQQTWLGCQAADTMAAVTALGVTYRVGQNVVYSALASSEGSFREDGVRTGDHLRACALYREWLVCPRNRGFIFADVVLRGFWPALAMGTFAAAAARSGSLPQLEMSDVIKPAACAFGTLFAVGTGSAILRSDRSIVKNVVSSVFGRYDSRDVFEWEQYIVDYGTYVGMACVPLYVYYQRYKV